MRSWESGIYLFKPPLSKIANLDSKLGRYTRWSPNDGIKYSVNYKLKLFVAVECSWLADPFGNFLKIGFSFELSNRSLTW